LPTDAFDAPVPNELYAEEGADETGMMAEGAEGEEQRRRISQGQGQGGNRHGEQEEDVRSSEEE